MKDKEFLEKFSKLRERGFYQNCKLSKQDIHELQDKIDEYNSFCLPLSELFKDTLYYKQVGKQYAYKDWCLIMCKIIELYSIELEMGANN